MGIVLGLLTALVWGSSDFVGRFAARRVGALRTALYMQFAGLLLLTVFLPWVGGWGHLVDGSGWQPWAWGTLAGVVNGISSLALYRAFEVGKLAVVAPLSASYPALTLVLSWFTGERLTTIRLAGIAFILVGVMLVARGEANSPESEGAPTGSWRIARGVEWALVSAVGFGVLFWLLGIRIVASVGPASTVWMIRLTSSALTALVILLLKKPFTLRAQGAAPTWLLAMGMMDTCAFVLNNRGMQIEQTSIISVLASLYGTFTVALAAIFLRERLASWQWTGIMAIFAGIYLISR